MNHPQLLARVAGLLYLTLAVLGGWAELGVRGSIWVAGNAQQTAANVIEHEQLLRWGLAADILMATVFVLLGLVLQRLLYSENARLATAIVVFVSVGAGAILVNLVFHAGALLVATDPGYLAAFGAEVRDALVLLLFELHSAGYELGGIFFGLWLLPVGLIARRSALFHRGVGVALIIGAIAWLFDPVLAAVLPTDLDVVRSVVSIPTSIAEFGLILYLLIVGVRRPGVSVA